MDSEKNLAQLQNLFEFVRRTPRLFVSGDMRSSWPIQRASMSVNENPNLGLILEINSSHIPETVYLKIDFSKSGNMFGDISFLYFSHKSNQLAPWFLRLEFNFHYSERNEDHLKIELLPEFEGSYFGKFRAFFTDYSPLVIKTFFEFDVNPFLL